MFCWPSAVWCVLYNGICGLCFISPTLMDFISSSTPVTQHEKGLWIIFCYPNTASRPLLLPKAWISAQRSKSKSTKLLSNKKPFILSPREKPEHDFYAKSVLPQYTHKTHEHSLGFRPITSAVWSIVSCEGCS